MKLDYEIAEHLGEAQPRENEDHLLRTIIEANKQMLPQKHKGGFRPGMRAQHPKGHATVRACFEVLGGLPDCAVPGRPGAADRGAVGIRMPGRDGHTLVVRRPGPPGGSRQSGGCGLRVRLHLAD